MGKNFKLIIFLLMALSLGIYGVDDGIAASEAKTDTSSIYMPVVAVNYYAPPMVIVETELLRSKSGKYYVTGNTQNQGPDTVFDVGVRVHFSNEQDQWIETYTSTVYLPANFPGHYNLFFVSTLINENDYPNASIETQVISWTLTSAVSYWPLTVVTSHAEETMSATRVQVVFRNDTPYTLTELHPLVWELHEYDYESSPIPSSLLPGDSFEYTIELKGVYGNAIPGIRIEGQGIAAP